MRVVQKVDAVSVLTVYLILLLWLPSRLGFAPLGGAGSPANIVGALCLGWWVYTQAQRIEPTRSGHQPVRFAYFALATSILISYVFAMTRAIEDPEANTALLGILGFFSLGGVLLLANDGITSYERLIVLLRRVVLAGAVLGALGIIQFITGDTWVDRISIPGLTANQALGGVSSRSGFNRPPGTAVHAIEFGVVLTMILPVALNLALTDGPRSRLRRWTPSGLIVLASILSISRSAIVGLVVGLLVVAIRWPREARRAAFIITPVFALVLFVTTPGILGTLLGLFTGVGDDSSVESRTDSYPLAFEFIGRSPLFGRGYATFLPSYRILDNQYLLLAVEIGLVGVAAMVVLLGTALVCAGRACRVVEVGRPAQACQALMASVAVATIELALFDMFSFPMAVGVLFLSLGLCGATWRLARAESSGAMPVASSATNAPTAPGR